MTKVIKSKDFTGTKAWEAMDIANMSGITTRLYWTDKPYKWHINDGEEVFCHLRSGEGDLGSHAYPQGRRAG